MTVQVYLGKKFEHSYERRALAQFLKDMLASFEDSETLYQVVVETKVNSADIDLLLISPTAIIIVEFKACVHAEAAEAAQIHLVGKLNDPWKYVLPNGREYTVGDPTKPKNPYRQTRDMRYELAKWLADNSLALLGQTWRKEEALEHIFAWVVVWPGFDGQAGDLALPPEELTFHRSPARWFQVVSNAQLANEFNCAPDTDLRLSLEQQQAVVHQLGVSHCQNLHELVPGYAGAAALFSKPPVVETVIDCNPQRTELLRLLEPNGLTLTVIEGLAGAGRTTLAAWLVGEAQRRSYRIRWVDCRDRPDLSIEALLASIAMEVSDLTRALMRDPDQPMAVRLDAALDFLNARPTLLVFDDYHALTNRASLEPFLVRAGRHHEQLRLVLTSRERQTDAAWLLGGTGEVELTGLALTDFSEFVSLPAHHVDLKPDDLAAIWRRLSGNPQAFLLLRPTIRRLALMGKLEMLPVINSEDSARLLLGNVSANAQQLAQRLSVLRTRFDFQTIQTLAQTTPERAGELTLELQDKYWLQAQSDGSWVMIELVRAALYERLTDKARREAHLQAGAHYGRQAETIPAGTAVVDWLLEAFYHARVGGPRKQFFAYAAAVIELLTKAGDRERVRLIADSTLAAAREERDAEALCYWLLRASRSAYDVEQTEQAGALLDEAAACLPATDRKLPKDRALAWQQLAAQVEYLRGRFAFRRRDYQMAHHYLTQAAHLAEASGSKALAAGSLSLLGAIARRRGDIDEAARLGSAALDLAQQLGDQKLICQNLGHVGLAARARARYEDARWFFARAFEIALTRNDMPAAEIQLGHLGRTTMLAGDSLEAERIFQRALKMARSTRNSIGMRIQLSNLAEVCIRQARYAEAEQWVLEAEELNSVANDQIGLAWNLKHRGQIAKAHGRIDHGNELIRQGLERLHSLGDQEYIPEFEQALRQDFQMPLDLD